MHKTIVFGNVCSDIVVNTRNVNGVDTQVANFSIASNFTDNRGVVHTTYFRCNVWGPRAAFCANNLYKGRKILVEGRVGARGYQDRDGKYTASLEIAVDMLNVDDVTKEKHAILEAAKSSAPAADARQATPTAPAQAPAEPNYAPEEEMEEVDEDDLPF